MTIPRLELSAAVVATRLKTLLEQELEMEIDSVATVLPPECVDQLFVRSNIQGVTPSFPAFTAVAYIRRIIPGLCAHLAKHLEGALLLHTVDICYCGYNLVR